ncbi:MAG: rRNA pseudouridine synthase [Ignavibacteriae bacterium]|nr:rRNA pseudouridine synthase [Ignavibacteriota bacterium]
MENKVRLNKFIANNGDISRRTADEFIQQRRVTVNNITVDFPSYEVDTAKDKVRVDGELIKVRTTNLYIALNKPAGVVSTVSDDKRRPTVVDLVKVNQKIYPIGRLDFDSTGLILLTNDGDLADSLMHPKHEVDKTYLVKLSKPLDEKHRHLLEKGIMLDKRRTKPAVIKFASRHSFDRLYITIHEGRNRQIRRMFERFGYFVDKLERTQFGPVKLGTLQRGKWRYLTTEEVKKLKK